MQIYYIIQLLLYTQLTYGNYDTMHNAHAPSHIQYATLRLLTYIQHTISHGDLCTMHRADVTDQNSASGPLRGWPATEAVFEVERSANREPRPPQGLTKVREMSRTVHHRPATAAAGKLGSNRSKRFKDIKLPVCAMYVCTYTPCTVS